MHVRRYLELIGGPRTYSWQAAVLVFLISIGFGYRLNYEAGATDPMLLLAVMSAVAAVTVSVFAVFAAGYSLLKDQSHRVIYALSGFFVVMLVRALVSDHLLIQWGLADASRLSWRLIRVFGFGTISLVSIAVALNLIYENKLRYKELRDRLTDEIRVFNSTLDALSEQRVYTIHEMSIETVTTQALLDELQVAMTPENDVQSILGSIKTNVVAVADILGRARKLTPVAIQKIVDVPKTSWWQENIPFLQTYRKELAAAISEVESRRRAVERTFESENNLWKQVLLHDVSYSPTAANVLLRLVVENPQASPDLENLQQAAQIWDSIAQESMRLSANSARLSTSGRLEP